MDFGDELCTRKEPLELHFRGGRAERATGGHARSWWGVEYGCAQTPWSIRTPANAGGGDSQGMGLLAGPLPGTEMRLKSQAKV